MASLQLVVALGLVGTVFAGLEAIADTDYEIGYCTPMNPIAPPPNPPGFWCDDFNRGRDEKACWTSTQNCCYLDMNKTNPSYPGTGQCVHADPCKASGGKLCGAKCYPLWTSDGLMTCLRSPVGTDKPVYTKDMCIGLPEATNDQFGAFLSWVCNPANSQVNCKMINPGGGSYYSTPNLRPASSPADDPTYTQGSYALHQYFLLTGQCNFPGQKVNVPSAGPTPPPAPPSPTPPPTPVPTLPPTPSNATTLFGSADCSTSVQKANPQCIAAFAKWVGDGKVSVGTIAVGWNKPDTIATTFSTLIQPVWDAKIVPSITWMPYPYKTWTNPSPNTDIANGQYDDYITAFYAALSTFLLGPDGKMGTADDRRAFIRFAPEANGNFFPWSPTCPSCSSTGQKISQSTASYVSMWKYVKSKATAAVLQSPAHVQWVWSVNNVDAPDGSSSATAVFPGVGVADWVAVDGLNWGTTLPGHSWQSASDIFSSMLATVRKLAPQASVAVTTFGSTSTPNGAAGKGTWLADAFDVFQKAKVGMVLAFNEDTSTDFAIMGGSTGDATATIDGQQYNVYKEVSTFALASSWFVEIGASNPQLITDSQFRTGHS